ncbi:MAG: excinuclease ABC subunit UvrC [Armatimonadota bacterium]|nr:MAG: excinuclease ABC subunit UvrC [Armatimonadota bacterium]
METITDQDHRPSLHEKLNSLPARPGAYLMKDAAGKVVYVGKAQSLRSRVRSYFQPGQELTGRQAAMVEGIADLDWIVTDSEMEALILEHNLIKRHRPRYNVRLRDDKRYPYIKITVNEEYPRLVVVRTMDRDGARYFGPYTSTKAMWQTVRLVRRIFGLRQALVASAKKRGGCNWEPGQQRQRPCLNFHMRQCLAPCVGEVSAEEYRRMVERAMLLLDGRAEQVVDDLRRRMEEASVGLRFEEAARLRDKIAAVEQTVEGQKMVLPGAGDADVIAHWLQEGEGSVVIFDVRDGKLVGQQHFLLDGTSGVSPPEVLGEFVRQYYGRAAFVPRQVIAAESIPDRELVEQWLSERRGGMVRVSTPKRGQRKHLVELAADNARMHLEQHHSREGAEQRRGREAVLDLQHVLDLPVAPERVEAYDIATIGGRDSVGSMVVFQDGIAKKADYRHFRIRRETGTADDYAMMREVLARRLQAAAARRKYARLPDLMLIDGGKGQLGVAIAARDDLGLSVPIAALAKGRSERSRSERDWVYLEGRAEPVIMPSHSRALHLLQRVRDEAHRFAQAYHHTLRARQTRESVLDEVPGVGPILKRRLVSHFGSMAKIGAASVEELAAVPGVGRKVAEAVKQHLARAEPRNS